MHMQDGRVRELVADVAAAYFQNGHVAIAEIPRVIEQIASSLTAIPSDGEDEAAAPAAADERPRLSASQIRRSIRPDALISFEDGRPYRTLTRHLAARGLTPTAYREKWGLPPDYPMVAADYSAARADMARKLGLGQRGLAARVAAKRGGAGRRITVRSPKTEPPGAPPAGGGTKPRRAGRHTREP